jgi:hypothetical protein
MKVKFIFKWNPDTKKCDLIEVVPFYSIKDEKYDRLLNEEFNMEDMRVCQHLSSISNNFKSSYPDDNRPRRAIEGLRDENINEEELTKLSDKVIECRVLTCEEAIGKEVYFRPILKFDWTDYREDYINAIDTDELELKFSAELNFIKQFFLTSDVFDDEILLRCFDKDYNKVIPFWKQYFANGIANLSYEEAKMLRDLFQKIKARFLPMGLKLAMHMF